jgi:hypothetical protein
VEADLPDDCAFASDDVESSMTGALSSKKRAKRNDHDELLASAIRDFAKHKGNSRALDVIAC